MNGGRKEENKEEEEGEHGVNAPKID